MNSKEEQFNSEEINEQTIEAEKFQSNEKIIKVEEDTYKFGWSTYSERTNGRFAMLGFLTIILIELLSNQSFLKWAGVL